MNVAKDNKYAVIFDMDGVLIDTVNIHWEIYNTMLKEKYNVTVKDEELAELIGMSLAEQIPLLNQKYGINIDADSFIPEAEQRKYKALSDLRPKDGVIEILRNLQSLGIIMGVGTSTPEKAAKQRLRDIGISDFFETIIGEESVTNHKPNPEVYLRVAEQLGYSPGACIVFEDAPNGIKAAKSAGMYCIGLENNYTTRKQLAEADAIISSFLNFSYSDILRTLNIHGE